MGFKKVEENEENLYLSDLDSNDTFRKVCYVSNYKSGVAVNSNGFYTLIVKTADGESVNAMIFNPKGFTSRGMDIASLRNKFIMLEGVGQLYNGSFSIIVDEIYTVDQSTVSDKEKFIGKIEDLDKLYDELTHIFHSKDLVLPAMYKMSSYSDFYGGRIGGYVKFLWHWVFEVAPYKDEFDEDLVRIIYYSSLYYSKYLDNLNDLDIVSTRDKVNILKDIPPSKDYLSPIADDLLSAMLGLSSPEHICSHLLFESFIKIKKMMKLKEMWNVMPVGGVKKLEENSYLRRY